MRPVIVALALAIAAIPLAGCGGSTYAQTIKVVVEPVNVSGLHAKIEYYRDAELIASMHFVDGNGDGIIDAKSGPKETGDWPRGWEWFDDLYRDVAVGHSTIKVSGDKLQFQDGTTYELVTGEYECERVG
jgi:hypothetical protein